MTPPIWEPEVLVGGTGERGHLCDGVQRREKRPSHRVRRALKERPPSAAGIGGWVPVRWEKCGRCEGVVVHGTGPVRIDDVPASELDVRMFPAESPRHSERLGWLFRRTPKRQGSGSRLGAMWNPKQGRPDVRLTAAR
jgi:hypothetical protein